MSWERVNYKSLELVTVARETTSPISTRSLHLSLLLCLGLRKSCNLKLQGGGGKGLGRRIKIMFQSKM